MPDSAKRSMRFFSPAPRLSGWMGWRARARLRRWPWCARARSRPGTRSRALRPHPALPRSWARPVSRPRLCRPILPKASATAFEAYCKVYTADVTPDRIFEFLLLDQEFPHSVRFSIDTLERALEAI